MIPEQLDTAITDDKGVISYAEEHFDRLRLHAIQIENIELEDLYSRVLDTLSKAKKLLPD